MSTQQASGPTGLRHFTMRRLHALTGLVPVGAFLIVHLLTNLKAVSGKHCFDHAVADIQRIPALAVIEVVAIALPLLFHAVLGIAIGLRSKSNVDRYGYRANWLFVLQRLTGVLAFVFLLVHLADFRLPKALGLLPHDGFFDALGSKLSVPWRGLLYLLGTSACVFHFINGVRTFLFSWGVTVSRPARWRMGVGLTTLGLLLWLAGAQTVLFFATGGSGLLPTAIFRGEGGRDLCEDAPASAAIAH